VHEVLSEFSRHGAQRLLVLIAHGEDEWFTREACDLAARDAAAAGREVKIMFISTYEPRDPGFIASINPTDEPFVPQHAHAAWAETSMMLHAFPDLVRRSEFPPDHEKATCPPYDVFPEPMDWVPASGVFSATSMATEELGRAIISHSVERIIEAARTEFGL
jgi:creatinine amidohydrolase